MIFSFFLELIATERGFRIQPTGMFPIGDPCCRILVPWKFRYDFLASAITQRIFGFPKLALFTRSHLFMTKWRFPGTGNARIQLERSTPNSNGFHPTVQMATASVLATARALTALLQISTA